MLVIRGRLENRQAIIGIGIQPHIPSASLLNPTAAAAQLEIRAYRALIDTGAQRSCLSRNTIVNEALVSHGKRQISNVHDLNVHRLYFVNLGFWANGDTSDPKNVTHSYFGWDRPIEVINIADNHNFDAIIGMDVLENFNFRFERTGLFELQLLNGA